MGEHDQCIQSLIEAKANLETQGSHWKPSMRNALDKAKTAVEEARTVLLSAIFTDDLVSVTCAGLDGNEIAKLHFDAHAEVDPATFREKILEATGEPQQSA